jgi:hypothetical protein
MCASFGTKFTTLEIRAMILAISYANIMAGAALPSI